MKHLKWVLAGLVLAVVPVLAWANIGHAQRFTSSVDKDQTVNSSVYSASRTVDINGTINGDVFCVGQSVNIDATVHGDVICAGQDVTISGTVDGNVRLAGQTVSIDANVAKNATVAGMTVSLDANAKIGQDLTATASTVNLKGAIGRDVVGGGTDVTFNGPVGRNVTVNGNQVNLKGDARIAGDFTYTSPNKVDQLAGAKVAGNTVHKTEPAKEGRHWGNFSFGFYLYSLIAMLLVALAFAYFFPGFLRRNTATITESFGKTLLIGLVAGLVIPMIAFGLVLTAIGIPLAIFILVATLFATMLCGPIAAYLTGHLIWRKQKNPLLLAIIGAVVLVTASYIPLLGLLVMMLAYWLGLGALLVNLRAHMQTFTPAKKASK